MFKLYDCDVGIKVDGVSYNFTHVREVQHEVSRRKRLTRGANAGNNVGLVYSDGITEPDRLTIPVMDLSAALKDVLDSAFENETRIEVYAISRTTGSSKIANQAILSNQPKQLTMDESPDSLSVSLEFESFDVQEIIK